MKFTLNIFIFRAVTPAAEPQRSTRKKSGLTATFG
jgi:hypothetical protein